MIEPTHDGGRPEDARRQVEELERSWEEDPRWEGIRRDYTAEDVVALRGSLRTEPAIARHGAERLRRLLDEREAVRTFGALTGAQAVQMVRAGLEAIYVSGWQVAGDMNRARETYPDMSLYPSDSVPALVERLNNALQRADQIDWGDEHPDVEWMAPIVADAEAGFGGPMHAFELTKGMIDAGAAAVHFEDQLASEKKCGHMGGKVLVPTGQFIRTLNGARLAADVLGVPTVVIARTDADAATLLTNDIDPRDEEFLLGERTQEGYHRVRGGFDAAEKRALAYAPYADLVWCETSTPDLEEARRFAEAVHAEFPDKPLAYNCSPSFNWSRQLEPEEIDRFHHELAEMGYCFQFVTLAGWHLINLETFRLARAYRDEGMKAYVRLQDREFDREADGYTAVRHQREVGAGYFDRVMTAVSKDGASTTSLAGSTEQEQFSEQAEAAETPVSS